MGKYLNKIRSSKRNFILSVHLVAQCSISCSGNGLCFLNATTVLLTDGALIAALLTLTEYFTSATFETLIYAIASLTAFCLGSVCSYICAKETFYSKRRHRGVRSSLRWITYQVLLAAIKFVLVGDYMLTMLGGLFVNGHTACDTTQLNVILLIGALVVIEGVFSIYLCKLKALFSANFRPSTILNSAGLLNSVIGVFAVTSLAVSFLCVPWWDAINALNEGFAATEFVLMAVASIALLLGVTILAETTQRRPALIGLMFVWLWVVLNVTYYALKLTEIFFWPADSRLANNMLGIFVDVFNVILQTLVYRYCELKPELRSDSERREDEPSEHPKSRSLLMAGTCTLPMDGTCTLPMDGTCTLTKGGSGSLAVDVSGDQWNQLGTRNQTAVFSIIHI